MAKIFYIYKISNTINDKSYVGHHIANNINNKYYGSGVAIKAAIKKYGKECFYKEILEVCESIDELDEREIFFIKKEKTLAPDGYNLTTGGSSYYHSKDIRFKQGKFLRNKTYTEVFGKEKADILLKLKSEINKGERNPMYGKKRSLSSRKKQSDSTKGKVHILSEVICPNCDKIGRGPNMKRYHFDNCKNKNN